MTERDRERFWSKVDQSTKGCWEWKGGKFSNGYGCFKLNGKTMKAHRVSYIIMHDSIPEGLVICHRCDNPSCVNPDHLFAATNVANTADRVAKKRSAFGLRNGWHTHPEKRLFGELNKKTRLQADDVRQIRQRYTDGVATIRELAREYGVWDGSIQHIIKRRTWKHIP